MENSLFFNGMGGHYAVEDIKNVPEQFKSSYGHPMWIFANNWYVKFYDR